MYIILKWSIIKMDSFSNNTKINVKISILLHIKMDIVFIFNIIK